MVIEGLIHEFTPQETGISDSIQSIIDALPPLATDWVLNLSSPEEKYYFHKVRLFWNGAFTEAKRMYEWDKVEKDIDAILRGPKMLAAIRGVTGIITPAMLRSFPLQINRCLEGDVLSWHDHVTANPRRGNIFSLLTILFDQDPSQGPCLKFRLPDNSILPIKTKVGYTYLWPAKLVHRVDINRLRIVANSDLPQGSRY